MFSFWFIKLIQECFLTKKYQLNYYFPSNLGGTLEIGNDENLRSEADICSNLTLIIFRSGQSLQDYYRDKF